MKKTFSIILKIIDIILIAVMVVVIISNIYILGIRHIKGVSQPTIFGYAYAVVLSGSMADTINVDDVVITKADDLYEPGDVIMFTTESSIVTHRIVDKTDEGYITKGDANNAEDNWLILDEQVIGKVVKVIPSIGKAIGFMQSPLGMMIITLIAFAMIMLPGIFKRYD